MPTLMKAARLHAYGKPLRIEDVAVPTPGPRQVVIRVAGAGFCHSDLHIIDGEIQILPRMPITLGHENAGFVAAAGAGVSSVREGDPVAVFGGWGCGHCDYCITGLDQLCLTPSWAGLSQYDGGYAEYLLVPDEKFLVKLGKLHPRDAASLTDAALTPYRAIKKAMPFLDADQNVLLVGLGGLGQYGLKLLRILSGCPVIVVETSESKRVLAKELGASQVIDGTSATVAAQVMDITGGRGVTASFDFVGSDATLALCIGTTKTFGKVSQVGLAGGTARLKVLENCRFETLFEVTLWGTVRELREVIALTENGRLRPIHNEFFPLEQIQTVYEKLKGGAVSGRAVITP